MPTTVNAIQPRHDEMLIIHKSTNPHRPATSRSGAFFTSVTLDFFRIL